jgi:hypothetical protein
VSKNSKHAPPLYATVDRRRVCRALDGRRDRPGYTGTILNVDDVKIIKGDE